MPQVQTEASDRRVDEAVRAARAMKPAPSTVSDNFQSAMERSMRDQPLTTLGLAVAAGFILGALWKA